MTKLRLLSFIAGVNLVSWGTLLAFSGVSDRSPALIGTAISLIAFSPLVSAALLRLLNRESWENAGLKLRLQEQKAWYGFGVGFPILVIGSILLLSILLGTGSVTYTSSTLISGLKLAGITFVPMFIASIGEEFGWRGYLEPNLKLQSPSLVVNHLIVGAVWGVWHLPILLLNESDTSLFELLMVFIGCLALGVIYGQVRHRSGSVWPCVLLHACSNSFTIGAGTSNLLEVEQSYKAIVSLSSNSIATVGVWIVIAAVFLVIMRKRQDGAEAISAGG